MEEPRPIRVTKTISGIYEFALPSHGAFTCSSLSQLKDFFIPKKLKFRIVKGKSKFSEI